MGYSKITLTFNDELKKGERLSFNSTVNDVDTNHNYIWVDTRFRKGQVEVMPEFSPFDNVGEYTAFTFMQMFNLDWNSTGKYNVVRVGNSVVIESLVRDVDFFGTFWLTIPLTINGNNVVDFSIENYEGTFFELESLVLSEATENDPCTHYKATIETSQLAVNVTSPIVLENNNDNPFSFEILRSRGFTASMESGDNQTLSLTVLNNQAPSVLSKDIFSITVNNSPNGATIVINNTEVNIIDLEYSLNNTDWQTENVFSGILAGNHTIYIRDNFGCSISCDININDENIYTPESYYSMTNSIIMVEQNGSDYKTEKNTLSNNSFAINPKLAHPEYHLFKSSHLITCQLRSNYQNINASIVKSDGSEVSLDVVKHTYNIGRKDSRDAIKFNAGSNQTGVYFDAGKLYDYDTDTYLNEDYTLLGALPEWAIIGNYFSIDNAFFKIENIYFDDELGAEVLLINSNYTGEATSIIVKSIFNRQNYEVYEWNILMSDYNDTVFTVKTIESDSRFETITRISENVMVKDAFENVVEIVSYNSKNTDVFYRTGIKHYALVHTSLISGDHEDISEVNKGDDSSALIDSKLYESLDFDFDLLSLGGYRQLVRMLSNNTIFIESQQFIKNGELEKEGPIEESNLYNLKAKMLYVNGVLNANATEIDLVTETESLEVPLLKITDDGRFINYR